MGVAFLSVVAGIGAAWNLYGKGEPDAVAIAAEPGNAFLRVLRHGWYVDEIYDLLVIRPLKRVSRTVLWRVVDDWVIQGFFVQFCGGYLWKAVGFAVSFTHSGRVGGYAFGIVLGFLLVVWIIAR